jgi:hypothetical protein
MVEEAQSARIEAACTVSTFVFMIAGWFAPRIELGQNWASAFFTLYDRKCARQGY